MLIIVLKIHIQCGQKSVSQKFKNTKLRSTKIQSFFSENNNSTLTVTNSETLRRTMNLTFVTRACSLGFHKRQWQSNDECWISSSWAQVPLFKVQWVWKILVIHLVFIFDPIDCYKYLVKIYKGLTEIFLQNRCCKVISILNTWNKALFSIWNWL